MWEAINNFLVFVDDKVWGVPLMVLIMAGGLLLTCRLGLLQIRQSSAGTEVDVQERRRRRWRNFQFCSALYSIKCYNWYR